MHELSLTRSIVAIAAEAAQGRPVRRVSLDIGKLSGVVPQAIAFCFEIVARGTALEAAALDIREIDAVARCIDCGRESATLRLGQPCPCGSHRMALLQGEELKVRAIEIEEAA